MGLMNKVKKKIKIENLKDNLKYLLTNNLYDREYKIKDETIEDCITFFDEEKESIKNINILGYEESLEKLLEAPKSYIRFGDGEVDIIRGHDSLFQQYDSELAYRLKTILEDSDDSFYVGINKSYYQSPVVFSEHNRRFYRIRGTELRRFFNTICSRERKYYLDASCFGAYFRFNDDFDYKKHYEKLEQLFKGKKVAVVAGEGIIRNLEFNLFSCADSLIEISAPKKNAYSASEKILSEIRDKVSKDTLVCLILGMTAKTLAYDLTKDGYIAWDVGHLAKDYDAYKKKLPKNEENKEKFWKPD